MSENFSEENGGGESSHSNTTTKSTDKPPSPRNETKLCGLRNQGATCYLNVLIQTLLFTPEFREPLFRLTPKDLNLPANYNDSNITASGGLSLKVRKIIVELQRLFAEMLLLDQQACSSTRLTDSFGWQSNEAVDHQDVHELNRLLFDAIQKSLQGTKQSNLIRSCYEGSTINYTQCKRCQKIFKRSEDYHDLPLVVQDSPNLHTSLANIFTISEQLVGDNQYRCSACSNNLCDAEKSAKISKLPPILTLPLQRFVYDTKTGNRQKKTTRYEFPFEIDLKPFCEDSVTETDYELFAVVIHKGTCYTGHYYGYIKDIDQIGTWTPPPPLSPSVKSTNTQDTSVSSTSPGNSKAIRNSNESGATPSDAMEKLELVKTLLLSCDDWVTIEYLLQTYRENTKESWSRTRGSNGSFTKFLRNHPKVFEVDEKRVRLVEQTFSMDIDDDNDVILMECDASEVVSNGNNQHDHPNEHWFCFDDSIVTCVTREYIEKHYGQNDCAYMLFYRQKNRHRSNADCSDQTHYAIPQWLLDEISQKNKTLEEKRETYDKQENQFSVTIYPNEWFEVIDGSRLNLNNNDQVLFPEPYGQHIFDRRTNINEFIPILENVFGRKSHFYIAKKLRSGQLHILNELISSTNVTSLVRSDLIHHPHIIVYKSPSLLPDTVTQGAEFEPIMLNIVYGFPDVHLHAGRLQTTKHISKNTTLLELKEILFFEYYQHDDPQKLRQIRMGKLNLEEKNNRKSRREYKPEEERQTLSQLRLQDGDTLGIDDKNFVPNWKDVSSSTTNLGKNYLSLTVNNAIETSHSNPMTYSCLNTTLVGEVKLMAIQAFGLALDPFMCRLHIDDDPDHAHIPLYDHQTVDSIEFKQNNTSLCLQFGQPLQANELLLYILSDRDPSSLELVVDQNMTLAHLWLLIKKELKMDDDENEYHLCEVKPALTDESSPLNDFDQSLTDNDLSNGTQLTMKAGSVPSKNHVRLKVLRIIEKVYDPINAIHTEPTFHMIELEESFELPLISPFNVLREQIAKHIDFKVPASHPRDVKALEFIRLYNIEDDQPTNIVHEPLLTTLKQAKVQDLDSYAFELLTYPESLAKKDLLLNIVYGKNEDDGDSFQHQFELHWPLKENIVAKYEYLEQHVLTSLTSFITNNLRFQKFSKQALKVTLARYFPDRAQWLIIDPRSSTNSNQTGNKKSRTSTPSSTKSNLRLEPYKLDDLVVIAVLEGENLGVENYETRFDRKKRHEIEREREQKKANRDRSRAETDRSQTKGSSNGRRKSPQNTMRIDVDDFDG